MPQDFYLLLPRGGQRWVFSLGGNTGKHQHQDSCPVAGLLEAQALSLEDCLWPAALLWALILAVCWASPSRWPQGHLKCKICKTGLIVLLPHPFPHLHPVPSPSFQERNWKSPSWLFFSLLSHLINPGDFYSLLSVDSIYSSKILLPWTLLGS